MTTPLSDRGAPVRRRVVLHFAGFEPLDATAHRLRYERAAVRAAGVWGCRFSVAPLDTGSRYFDVEADGPGWRTQSRIYLFDLAEAVEGYRRQSLALRIVRGYAAAAQVVLEGGFFRYLRHAWRFAVFFVFPYLLMSAGLAAAAAIAAMPALLGIAVLHSVWSIPAAFIFFRFVFLPFSDRYHTLHLFSDWQMAVALAHDDAGFDGLLKRFEQNVHAALEEAADEVLITSHSIGTSVAVHVVGRMLERDPKLFAGRKVRFVTLGGAVLQSAFLNSAGRLRARVGLIAAVDGLFWLDVQCLTDVVNFYRSHTFALCGHGDIAPAALLLIRFKHMLDREHYKRIKRDALRVHRQYVLGCDRRSPFEFTLMTAGPLAADAFADFSPANLPPLADGPTGEKSVATP